MTAEAREQTALNAYLSLMKSNGASQAELDERSKLLQYLFPHLSDQPQEGWLYRDVVETMLDTLERKQWPLF